MHEILHRLTAVLHYCNTLNSCCKIFTRPEQSLLDTAFRSPDLWSRCTILLHMFTDSARMNTERYLATNHIINQFSKSKL